MNQPFTYIWTTFCRRPGISGTCFTKTYFFFWMTHVPKRMYPHFPIASEFSSIIWAKSFWIIFPSLTKINLKTNTVLLASTVTRSYLSSEITYRFQVSDETLLVVCHPTGLSRSVTCHSFSNPAEIFPFFFIFSKSYYWNFIKSRMRSFYRFEFQIWNDLEIASKRPLAKWSKCRWPR